MEDLRVDKLKRDSKKILSYFKEVKNTIITTQPIQIVFPARFIDLKLAKIDGLVDVVGYYAILDDKGNYAVVIAPVIGKYSPDLISYVMIDNEKYACLSFKAGDTVVTNTTMLANDNFLFDLYTEFFTNGNIPWYMNYEDVSNIFLETSKYASSGIGNNPIVIEILTAIIARVKNNKRILYKDTLKSKADIYSKPPSYIGVSNIHYSYDSTSSRIIGGYFKEGVINSVVDPETKTTRVADNLRH